MIREDRQRTKIKQYVSIDVGGTAIKYGVIRGDGKILSKDVVHTEAQKGGPAILLKVQTLIQQILTQQ